MPRKGTASATLAPDAAKTGIDLAEHQEELGRLVAFLQLSTGFTLGLAECNLPSLRSAVIAEAARRTEPLGVEIVTLDLGSKPDLTSPLDEIAARLERLPPAAEGKKRALMVLGLDASVRITDPLPGPLVDLNLMRDLFPQRIAHPMVLWLPDYLLTKLSQVAPDFWSWSSGTFRFPAPAGMRDALTLEWLQADEPPAARSGRASAVPPVGTE